MIVFLEASQFYMTTIWICYLLIYLIIILTNIIIMYGLNK